MTYLKVCFETAVEKDYPGISGKSKHSTFLESVNDFFVSKFELEEFGERNKRNGTQCNCTTHKLATNENSENKALLQWINKGMN